MKTNPEMHNAGFGNWYIGEQQHGSDVLARLLCGLFCASKPVGAAVPRCTMRGKASK